MMNTMMRCAVAITLVAGCAMTVQAGEIDVSTYWSAQGDNHFSFSVDGKPLCQFDGRSPSDDNPKLGHCRFTLPPGTKQLTVSGDYTAVWWDGNKNKTAHSKGEHKFVVRDGTPLSAPLRDASLSLSERWHRAATAAGKFVPDGGDSANMDFGKKSTPAELDAAEKRLGFALPADYRKLLLDVGPVHFGDSAVADVALLRSAHDTLLKDWSYGDGGTPKWIGPEALALLQQSSLLFFEVGDGMGAQLYLPPPNKPCGDKPGYLWLHEESLSEDIRNLVEGKLDCSSFDAAMLKFHQHYVVAELAQQQMEEKGELVIDTGAPVYALSLHYAADPDGKFSVTLENE